MSEPIDTDQSLHDSRLTVLAIRAGDSEALGRLATELRPYLRQVVRNELKNYSACVPQDDSDLIQQALLKAVNSIDTFRGASRDEWRLWLAAIARNEVRMCARYWNSEKRSYLVQSDCQDGDKLEVVANDNSPAAEVYRQELSQKLEYALAQLSESERQIIAWRQNELLSHAEVATRLGISVDAARQRCKSAMDHLRAHFRHE